MNTYLTNSYYQTFTSNSKKTPRTRYTQYVSDLYKMYQNTVNPFTFYEGDQLTYAEMGSALLDKIFSTYDAKLFDLVVISYWTHEFDPDYVACGPYFAEKYGIRAAIFDVSDQGTISPFTALQIIKQYLQGEDYHKGILLAFEQTTVPRNMTEFNLIPTISSAAALITEKNKHKETDFKLIENKILTSQQILHNFNIIEFIKSECERFNLSLNQVILVLKKGTFGWKSLQYHAHKFKDILNQLELQFYDYRPSCLSPIEYLHNQMHNQKSERSYYFILAEDIESLNHGYLLIKREGNHDFN